MSRGNKLPFERGKSAYQNNTSVTSTDLAHLEGQVVYLPHTNYSDKKKRDSNTDVVAIVVRNVSGENLLPGDIVSWETLQYGKQVTITTDTDQHASFIGATALIAGVVDDQLPAAGVQNNDLFYLIVKGPAIAHIVAVQSTTAHVASGNLMLQGGPLVASSTKGYLAGAVMGATDDKSEAIRVQGSITLTQGGSGGTARNGLTDAKTGSVVTSGNIDVTVWVNTGIV
jgi:hypothetical protein